MSGIHALLIGVDQYRPNCGPDRVKFPNLEGAVNDTLRMESYLREGPFRVPPERIRTLVSPGYFSPVPVPPSESLPTYANIVREIEALARRVGEGDQVLIQFSGHGARVPSLAAVKGRGGLDEAIVPLDGADLDGGVLRDVVIYRLLSDLSATGAYVTVILDSCHAGSALRRPGRGGVRVRGLGRRSGTWGPRTSGVGSWHDLYAPTAVPDDPGQRPRFRHVDAGSGWFPVPERCVLLAACRAPEAALEGSFGWSGVSGAFTHFLLEALEGLGDRAAYATLQQAVRELLQAAPASQIPILEGDGELGFLGAGRRPAAPGSDFSGPDEEAGRQLDHDERYAQIHDLSTPTGSSLAGSLALELCKLRRKEDWADPALRVPVRGNTFPIGELLCLLVHNRSDQVLNLVVLDVRSDGAVECVHPKKGDREIGVIDPGDEYPVYLETWLPDTLSEAASRVKVLAALGWIGSAAFELPVSGGRATGSVEPRWPPRLPLPADGEWVVADLELNVVR